MTRACCPSCRLRFSRAAAAHLTNCPECGTALQVDLAARDTMGYRLFDEWDSTSELLKAIAVALPTPDWTPRAH
jgi:transcription initiation factor IIE alpha subunit